MEVEQIVEFEISRHMASQLGYYVYLYLDPVTNLPLYVGKGRGTRILSHLRADGDCDKGMAMCRLRESGQQPVLKFIRYGLTDTEALLVESAVIDIIGLDQLTNKISGHNSIGSGLMTFEQLQSRFATEEVVVAHSVLMIRLPRAFRYDMTPVALFEATCGTWKIGERRNGVQYVLAVHDNVIQEVYEVTGWQEGGTMDYSTREMGRVPGRWEFTGHVVSEDSVRDRYLRKSVKHLFTRGSQNPIRYAFPDGSAGDDSDDTLANAA